MNGEFKVKTLYVILTTMAIIAAPIIYVSNIKASISEADSGLSERIHTNEIFIEVIKEDVDEIKGDIKAIRQALEIYD